MEKERIKKETDAPDEGHSQEQGQAQGQNESPNEFHREGGDGRKKFTSSRSDMKSIERGSSDIKSQVAVFYEENNQTENIENISQVPEEANASVEKNGNGFRNRSDNKRGDSKVDKHRTNRSKPDNHRYNQRDSRDRTRKRGRSRSRDRRRSRDRDQSQRSSRDRKSRRHHSPRRRSSARSGNRSDRRQSNDRRDRRERSKKSSNAESKTDKKPTGDRKSEIPEEVEQNLVSVVQPKFKRQSRSSSGSSRASKA